MKGTALGEGNVPKDETIKALYASLDGLPRGRIRELNELGRYLLFGVASGLVAPENLEVARITYRYETSFLVHSFLCINMIEEYNLRFEWIFFDLENPTFLKYSINSFCNETFTVFQVNSICSGQYIKNLIDTVKIVTEINCTCIYLKN